MFLIWWCKVFHYVQSFLSCAVFWFFLVLWSYFFFSLLDEVFWPGLGTVFHAVLPGRHHFHPEQSFSSWAPKFFVLGRVFHAVLTRVLPIDEEVQKARVQDSVNEIMLFLLFLFFVFLVLVLCSCCSSCSCSFCSLFF